MSIVRAYIGLGSNLQEPVRQIQRAITQLSSLQKSRLLAVSSMYGNPPMGPQDQPDFVNAVAAMETELSARALLKALQEIERQQGRERSGERWGPRTIDLDLLVFGAEIVNETGLEVPHPGIGSRAFVLIPLREIAPGLVIPGLGEIDTVTDAMDASALCVIDSEQD